MLGVFTKSFPNLANAVAAPMRGVPLIVVLGLLAACFEGLGIGLVIPLLGIIMEAEGGSESSGVTKLLSGFAADLGEFDRVLVIATAIFTLILLKNVVGLANAVLSGLVYGKAGHAIRIALADRLLTVGFPFFHKQDPGRLLNVISTESWRASDAISATLSLVINACAALILYAFLLFISWQLTLTVTLALGVIQALHHILSARLKAASRAVTSKNQTLASRMLHLVHNGQLVRMFGQQPAEQNRFDAASDSVRRTAFSLHRRAVELPAIAEVLYAAVFLLAVILAWRVGVSFPVISAFLVLLYRLQPYVRGLQGNISQLQSLRGSLEEVEWLLEPAGKPSPPQGTKEPGNGDECIRFQNVSFSYAREQDAPSALERASFVLAAGEATALVGRSGAGKTTIVKLLTRLVDATDGNIYVGSQALTEIDPDKWRRLIAVASQDLELVDGTVFENIAYGVSGASRDAVMEAARRAEAHQFIADMPDGYDTLVGYRGLNLSAGQRQRIALARALVRDPPILILDEATSAVDGISEAAIIATLKQRAGTGTTIVISHHRSTIQFCDSVIVLRDRKVAGTARHDQVKDLGMDQIYELF